VYFFTLPQQKHFTKHKKQMAGQQDVDFEAELARLARDLR